MTDRVGPTADADADAAWLRSVALPGAPATEGADHRIGDWTLRSDLADIRAVRLRGREIVRRLFVTVRDATWREIPPMAWSSEVDASGSTWRIRLAAEYHDGDIALGWRGVFELDPGSGRASFRIAGLASSDFEVNRLGLVVLHAAEELVGGTIETRGSGATRSVRVTRGLLPQHVVAGLPTGLTEPFDRLATTFGDGTVVDFSFEGQLFEIEDQRNFGDSSFKSYCPPLAGGFPYAVADGSAFEHSVSWTVAVADDARPAPRVVARGVVPSVVLPAGANPGRVRVGTAAEAGEVRPGDEIVLEVGPGAAPDPDLLARIAGARPARVLVVEPDRALARPGVVAAVRTGLQARGCDAPVGTALEDYFVEANRGGTLDVDGALDVLVCPAVHSGDPLTIAENVPAVPEIVATAASRVGGREVSVSLSFGQGPPPGDAAARIALPWAVATIAALTGSAAASVAVGPDLVGSGAALDRIVAVLARARGSGEATVDVGIHDRVHRLHWRSDLGEEELIVNLGPVAIPRPTSLRSFALWPPASDPDSDSIPFGGIMRVERA